MKKSIIVFLFCFICSFSLIAKQHDNPIIKFGIIADIQYSDNEPSRSRFYKNSLPKLDSCVIDLNNNQVQFSIVLGDLVDKDTYHNIDSILIRLKKLNNPVYNTTGNHDYGGVTNNTDLYEKLNMPAEYYSFTKENWVFIMLNTNEIASYANIKNTEKELEYTDLIRISKETDRSNGATYNGGISNKQMKWLEFELDHAKACSKNVIIFTHHPLYGDDVRSLTALNNIEIINLLSKYSNVKSVVSGHHHAGDFGIYNGISYITTEGMVETENENAYGIIEIYSNKIELIGKGRSRSHIIIFDEK